MYPFKIQCLIASALLFLSLTLSSQNVGINVTYPKESLHIQNGGLLVEGPDYIPVIDNNPDTIFSSIDIVMIDTSGYLFDSGGPDAGYSANQFHQMSIDLEPMNTVVAIDIDITQMALGTGDSLVIAGMVFHNGDLGSIRVDGDYVFISFFSNDVSEGDGFELHWQALTEINTDTISIQGKGSRLMWTPSKRALRSGIVLNKNWDLDSVGLYSAGLGYNILASGKNSFSVGEESKARGKNSISMGAFNDANGIGSIALGQFNSVNGDVSAAIGSANKTSNSNNAAIGFANNVSGTTGAIAMGHSSIGAGNFGSIAAGYYCEVGGNQGSMSLGGLNKVIGSFGSIALGYEAEVFGDNGAIAIGNKIRTNGNSSITIGKGMGDNLNSPYLETNIDNSLMIGFLSDVPTFYVGPGNGSSGSIGKVGIGTTSPEKLFEISNTGNPAMRITSSNAGNPKLELHRTGLGNWNIENDGGIVINRADQGQSEVAEYVFLNNSFIPKSGETNTLGTLTNSWKEGYFGDFVQVKESGVSGRMAASASSVSIGSTSNHGLNFLTNNNTQMHINPSGNVGIGTTSPEYPLHIDKTGTNGQATIAMVLESNTSNRPTLLFSENASSIDLDDGMSLEYDGAIVGNKFYINGVGGIPRLTVENFGEVGIGTIQPTEMLEVSNSGDTRIRITSTNNVSAAIDLVRSSTGNTDWRIKNDGNLKLLSSTNIDGGVTEYYSFGTGIFRPSIDNALQCGSSSNRWTVIYAVNGTIQTSDIRFKKGIQKLPYGLNEVIQLKPVTYFWKDNSDTKRHVGLIAQEVKEIIPEVVMIDDQEHLGMNYAELVPVLINAVKELKQENDELKVSVNDLTALANEMNQLKAQLADIQRAFSSETKKIEINDLRERE